MDRLLSFLLFAAPFYLMMRFGCGAHMVHGGHGGHEHDGLREEGKGSTKGPVCGMPVGHVYSFENVCLERLRNAAETKTSGTSAETSIMIFERFDMFGRMKNVGQERLLILMILLLVSLAELSDVSAFAADRKQQVKVGKEGDITLQVETRVGAVTLKPGRYFIRHKVSGDDHFMQFTEVTKGQGKNTGGFPVSLPVEVKCRLLPTERKVRGTIIIYANNEAGVRQIETVLVSGENVAHGF